MSFIDRLKNSAYGKALLLSPVNRHVIHNVGQTDWSKFFDPAPEAPAWMHAVPNAAWDKVGLHGVSQTLDKQNEEMHGAPNSWHQFLSAADTASVGYDGGTIEPVPEGTFGAHIEHALPTSVAHAVHSARQTAHGTSNEAGALDPIAAGGEALDKVQNQAVEALRPDLTAYHPPAHDFSVVPGDPNANIHVNLQAIQRLAALNGQKTWTAMAQPFDQSAYQYAGRPTSQQLARGELPSNKVIGGINDLASLQALARQRAAANPGALLTSYGTGRGRVS